MSDEIVVKRCCSCKKVKPIFEFSKVKRYKDGHDYECKACRKIRSKKYREENKDRLNAQTRQWYQNNKVRVYNYNKERRIKNKEEIAAYQKEYSKRYREEHKEKLKEYFINYNIEKREERSIKSRKYREENKGKIKEAQAEYYNKNKEKFLERSRKRKALKKGSDGTYSSIDIELLYKLQEGKCPYCPAELSGGCHIDHWQPLTKKGSNWPENIQLLCASCNLSKNNKSPIEFENKIGFDFYKYWITQFVKYKELQ